MQKQRIPRIKGEKRSEEPSFTTHAGQGDRLVHRLVHRLVPHVELCYFINLLHLSYLPYDLYPVLFIACPTPPASVPGCIKARPPQTRARQWLALAGWCWLLLWLAGWLAQGPSLLRQEGYCPTAGIFMLVMFGHPRRCQDCAREERQYAMQH